MIRRGSAWGVFATALLLAACSGGGKEGKAGRDGTSCSANSVKEGVAIQCGNAEPLLLGGVKDPGACRFGSIDAVTKTVTLYCDSQKVEIKADSTSCQMVPSTKDGKDGLQVTCGTEQPYFLPRVAVEPCQTQAVDEGVNIICPGQEPRLVKNGGSCSAVRDHEKKLVNIQCPNQDDVVIKDGETGPSCSVTRVEQDKEVHIKCPNEAAVVVKDGLKGDIGASCEAVRHEELAYVELKCPGRDAVKIKDGGSCQLVRDDNAKQVTINCPNQPAVTLKDGAQGEKGLSCKAVREEESTFVTLTCPEQDPVIIRDGEPGPACQVVRKNDSKEVEISCGGQEAIVLKDGEKGERGDACKAYRDDANKRVELSCPGQDPVSIKDGEKGESCRVSRQAGAKEVTISCPNQADVVVLDGEKGNTGANGAACSAVHDNAKKQVVLTCPGQQPVVIHDGEKGEKGDSCTAVRVDNRVAISCGSSIPVYVEDGLKGEKGDSCATRVDGEKIFITCGTTTNEFSIPKSGDVCQFEPKTEGVLVTCKGQEPFLIARSPVAATFRDIDVVYAVQRINIPKLKSYLAAGADPNIKDSSSGESLLHLAVHSGSLQTVQILVDAGADINSFDADDRNPTRPIDQAFRDSEMDIAEYLLRRGATCGHQDFAFQVKQTLARSPKEDWNRAFNLIRAYRCLEMTNNLWDGFLDETGLFKNATADQLEYALSLPLQQKTLSYSRVYQNDRVEVIKTAQRAAPALLKTYNDEFGYPMSPMVLAVRAGANKIIRLLLDQGEVLPPSEVNAGYLMLSRSYVDREDYDYKLDLRNFDQLATQLGLNYNDPFPYKDRFEKSETYLLSIINPSTVWMFEELLRQKPDLKIPEKIAYSVTERILTGEKTLWKNRSELASFVSLLIKRGGRLTEGDKSVMQTARRTLFQTGGQLYDNVRIESDNIRNLMGVIADRNLAQGQLSMQDIEHLLLAHGFEDAANLVKKQPSVLGALTDTACGKVLLGQKAQLEADLKAAAVDTCQIKDYGVLSLAVGLAQNSLVQGLLDNGASPEGLVDLASLSTQASWDYSRATKRYTLPLMIAIYNYKDEALRILLDKGAKPNFFWYFPNQGTSDNPLLASIYSANPTAHKMLTERFPIGQLLANNAESKAVEGDELESSFKAFLKMFAALPADNVPTHQRLAAVLPKILEVYKPEYGIESGLGSELTSFLSNMTSRVSKSLGFYRAEYLQIAFSFVQAGASPSLMDSNITVKPDYISLYKLQFEPKDVAWHLSRASAKNLIKNALSRSSYYYWSDADVIKSMGSKEGNDLRPYFIELLKSYIRTSESDNKKTLIPISALASKVEIKDLKELDLTRAREDVKAEIQRQITTWRPF